MENLKIKVNSESESKEVQELFFELGYRDRKNWTQRNPAHESIQAWKDGEFTFSLNHNQVPVGFKETTLQELRDMVVLKRNDPKDATHKCLWGVNPEYYIGSKGSVYFYKTELDPSCWVKTVNSKDWCDKNLKPIKEEVMKEYLVKTDSCNYLYAKNVSDIATERVVEIPEGADVAVYPHFSKGISFFKNNFRFAYSDSSGEWKETDYCPENLKHWKSWRVAWQRESLNDKIATAEVARQESKSIDATLAERQLQYGCFEDVAFVTENIMSILSKVRPNGLQELPNTHRMALYMIASKMARIVNGDFNHLDSWHDIGGYSKLIEDLIGDSGEI